MGSYFFLFAKFVIKPIPRVKFYFQKLECFNHPSNISWASNDILIILVAFKVTYISVVGHHSAISGQNTENLSPPKNKEFLMLSSLIRYRYKKILLLYNKFKQNNCLFPKLTLIRNDRFSKKRTELYNSNAFFTPKFKKTSKVCIYVNFLFI